MAFNVIDKNDYECFEQLKNTATSLQMNTNQDEQLYNHINQDEQLYIDY